MKIAPYLIYISSTIIALSLFSYSKAQLPVCSGPGSGLIYYVVGNTIYNLDPTQPLSASNPTVNTIPAPGAGGIAVNNNINGPGPSPTFYTVVGANYHYYDGTAWVNTGHTSGGVNPGGSGNIIYSLVGSSGEIYKYDGTGNATLLTTITDFSSGGPFDCVADCQDNFYVLRLDSSGVGQYLRKYSPTGTILQTYTVTGATSVSSGGGMAIIGNNVYYQNTSGYWGGTVVGTNINFTQIATALNPSPSDFSSCALGAIGSGGNANASADTLYICDTNDAKLIYSIGHTASNIITWQVIAGTAGIAGAGDTISVTAKSNARILLSVTDTSLCGSVKTDTIYLLMAKANIDAGEAFTIVGCNVYKDTINAVLKDTLQGLKYNIGWQPADAIVSGLNTLRPIINPIAPTMFTVTISTSAEQGGCTWTDTITAFTQNQVKAIITASDSILCTDEYALFNANNSVVFPYINDIKYQWDYRDGSLSDSLYNQHTFLTPGSYTVQLIVRDSTGCADTAYKTIMAYIRPYVYLGSDTNICNGVTMTIPATRKESNVLSYLWSDGETAPTKPVNNSGFHILQVSNECGSFSDSIVIGLKDCSVWFPSAFTPNGDGLNDMARVLSKHLDDIDGFELMIVNRFGEKVFKTNNPNAGWDGNYKGSPAALGTFYYLIQYNLKGSDKQELLKGDLILVR